MRVTENSNYDAIRDSVSRSKHKLEDLQVQAASLRKLNYPSDDPVGSSKILELRTEKMNNDQYQTNAKLAEAFLSTSETAVADLVELVSRAKEIAIGQSSTSTSSENTRLAIAEEVNQLYQQAISVANRRLGERYLFGGYKTHRPPVDHQGKYSGDQGLMMVEISKDVFVTMNVPGIEVFNTHPEQSEQYAEEPENVNLFDELRNFRIGLLTGNLQSIHSTLEGFDQLHSKLVTVQAKLGSRLQGIRVADQAIERQNITNASLSSGIEDADVAQVATDMSKEEAIFRNALASSKRLIQPTLLDFLR